MTPRASYLYRKMLSKRKQRVTEYGECLILYLNTVGLDDLKAIEELIRRKYIEKCKLGDRIVYIIGRFTEEFKKNDFRMESQVNSMLEDFPEDAQPVIRRAFRAFAAMRKNNKVSESVLMDQLHYYQQYPVDVVIRGLNRYLDRGCWREGKGERYACGIIKNIFKVEEEELAARASIPKSNPRNKAREESRRKIKLHKERNKLYKLMIKVRTRGADLPEKELAKICEEVDNEIAERERSKGVGYWVVEKTIEKLEKRVEAIGV